MSKEKISRRQKDISKMLREKKQGHKRDVKKMKKK